MNRRTSIIVTCALVLSVCVSYLVYRAVGNQTGAGKTQPAPQVTVAARDLEPGSLIRDVDLKTAVWYGSLPKGAVLKRSELVNRAIASAIYEGEVVSESRLAPRGSVGGLAATIPQGLRACAVRVNDVAAVAGFAVPGMRVDVLITGHAPGSNVLDGPRVRTLLQNIQVLSAGMRFQKDQEGKPEQAQVVNLLVTPEQAEILSLASNENHIQLVLRNPSDDRMETPPGTFMSNLFGKEHAPESKSSSQTRRVPTVQTPPPVPVAAEPVAPAPYVIQVSNGAVRTEVKVALSEVKP